MANEEEQALLSRAAWMYPLASRQAVLDLISEQTEGVFGVRSSGTYPGCFVLCLSEAGTPREYLIKRRSDDGAYHVEYSRHAFSSLPDLIAYYSTPKGASDLNGVVLRLDIRPVSTLVRQVNSSADTSWTHSWGSPQPQPSPSTVHDVSGVSGTGDSQLLLQQDYAQQPHARQHSNAAPAPPHSHERLSPSTVGSSTRLVGTEVLSPSRSRYVPDEHEYEHLQTQFVASSDVTSSAIATPNTTGGSTGSRMHGSRLVLVETDPSSAALSTSPASLVSPQAPVYHTTTTTQYYFELEPVDGEFDDDFDPSEHRGGVGPEAQARDPPVSL
ncbi:hypothetical protein PTSG_08067 [Salpingoeca rosetta]|uniref:SH2 domain-containing protein n=1 Tax=Salpingoeca rosetta (strain ATCC 50818 / BSB-021) TaxID=946362 RepID=F2UHW7_SALR5|nr:uncharacterized protein PTSG_08067 [Salpingoeca rosetta]EGD76716.1 hypothetical protein PTSG_08067 [Salpingoeca rosetta]|eukprot:XP_004991088.1 hypothetical protein PTSG_08067 [Salpingoeca rosetta]